jgi:uroporphyrinogen decarboxylase
MNGEARLLAAARRERADCTPVWFMRQAGRCLAEYRQLRRQYDILTLARTPELSTQVTLMPVERFGVDGAVMFADIMLPLEAMGAPFEIQPDVGPIVHHPIRTRPDVARLRVVEGEEATPYVMETIRLLRRELAGGKAALIGFSGAPFTLACYLIEGRPSRDYAKAKGLMFSDPATWHALMDKVADQVISYLQAQVRAGIQVAQVFDSWMGILSPQDYERYSLPYSRRVFDALAGSGLPRIHFGTGNASLLELVAGAGADLVSVDWRIPLDVAWQRIGPDLGIQGNLDPVRVLAPWDQLWDGAADVLRRAAGRPGHIFNLGHGVLPDTNPDHLARLVEAVHHATAAAPGPATHTAGAIAGAAATAGAASAHEAGHA